MSLRWKIAAVVAVLAGLATTTVGLAGYRSTRERLFDEVDASLGEFSPHPFDFAEVGVPDWNLDPRDLRELPLLVGIQVFDESGLRFSTIDLDEIPASALAVRGLPGRSQFANVESDGEPYRIHVVGMSEGGAFVAARPLDEVNHVLASLRARTVVVVIVVTAAAALLGWMIAGSVTAGLRRLTTAAASVGATGRLDVDVPANGSDEIGRLGTAFAGMLAALRRSRVEQQRLVEDAGHELKTPLTSIRTNLDVLRRHADLEPESRAQVVDDLHDEVEDMVDLVEQIVAVAGGVDERKAAGQ